MRKKSYLIISFILLCFQLGAQQNIIPPTQSVRNSFAIFVDEGTFNACKSEIMAYRDVIEKDGLATYIISADWESPEHVKFFIDKYYKEQGLEGAVFVGNIPIAMIRGAQHFTSAFKMDEENNPLYDSSVPSDRFYDDLNLKFDFIQRDTTYSHLFYYWLRGDSPQRINCTIYSGRIRSTLKGEAGYDQIRKYLTKVVTERATENPLDKIVSYTGEGSFSNSLAAWKDESITMREQIPAAFQNDANGAKFYIYNMYPFMKEVMIEELKREDVDLMLFHEHGMPERQYLTGNPPALDEDANYENGKRAVREYMRNVERRSTMTFKEAKDNLTNKYGIDSTWFEGISDPKVIEQDSLEDLKTGIILDDIRKANPNPRVVVFDACYNGDFRNEGFVAGEYIFSKGKTIACFANSVNVLQDKSSTDLMGLLACGMRIGEWTKQINILESHIIGDPTYRFARPKMPRIKMHSTDTDYWLAILGHNFPVDIHSLALYKLFNLNYEGMSELLYKTYKESPYYTQRLQCMHLLAYYNDNNYQQLLKDATEDPYEFIRRKAVYYMGRVGRNDFVPYIVNLYLNDYLSERVAFNVSFTAHHLSIPLLKETFEKAINKSEYIYDKKEYWEKVENMLNTAERTRTGFLNSIIDTQTSKRNRMFYVVMIRNNPFPQVVDDVLNIIENNKEDVKLRIALAEGLGWYVRSERKGEIIETFDSILKNEKTIDPKLADELTKTINRLKEYMR
ncbi:MAG: hypothetical protein M0R23_00040 [Bacteroidales bacterium]|nr:hypothetical protein [Bacteroidales bacterium]